MTPKNLLKILFVEDLPSDVDLAVLELRKEKIGFEHTTVCTRADLINALKVFKPDLIISDYMMPSFNGLQALNEVKKSKPEIPFILFTGTVNEETAVECLKAGATDYVLKEHLIRLPFAVREALEQNRIQIEKRVADLLLKGNEEKLQSIFRVAPVGIGLVVNRVFMEVNDTFCKMTGYDRRELIGKNAEMIYVTNEEYDRVGIEKYGQIAEKGTGSVETRFKCKDGSILNIFLSSSPLDKDDLTKGVTFTVMDITKRKLAEKALRESQHLFQTLAQVSPVGIFRTDPYGYTTYVNPKWIELSGLSSEEAFGNGWLNAVHPEDREKLSEAWLINLKSKNVSSAEYRFLKPDGGIIWVMGKAVPELSGNEVTGYIGTITDITERKWAEEALRESEEKYRLLIDTANESIIVAQDGLLKFVNKMTIELLEGYSEQELIGRPFPEFIHPDDRRMVVENYRRRIENEAAQQQYAFRVVTRDGIVKWVEINAVLIEWQGKPATLNFLSDITERKRADEGLKESETSLRNAQEIAKMGSWEWDLVTQKTNWSDNYFAIHGFKPAEIEPSFEFFRNRIHPEDVHFLDEIHANIMKDKTPSSFELRLILTDGTVKWIQNNISPVIEDDKLVKLKGVIIDITERKRAEEALRESEVRYKTLFSNAAEGILVAKIETMQFLYTNPALCKMFGYTEEELMRMGVKDIHPKESLDYVLAEFEAQMLDKKTLASDIPCLRKDGTLFHADIRTTSMVLDGFKCSAGFFIDITDRKQSEKELLKHRDHLEELVNKRTEELGKAKKEADEANKAKSEFLANMSHEIRTPMNAVLGYTELLNATLVDQTQKDYINSIKSSGKSLLTLINDILDLSKIEAGKLELEYAYVDTYSFFSEFERIFSLKVTEKGLKFILDITSGTPHGVYIDEARVRQIVFNLIGNAIKFTSEGKITLKVFTENPQIVSFSKEKSEEVIDLIIEVQDTGIGISKELQEAIFEPFVQERDYKHYGGTGLGLTITRRLTALMDGTTHVQSKPGKGSTFTVRIPEIAYLRDFSKTTVDIEIDPAEIVFEKAAILIADDVQHNRSYLRDALKNTNLKIAEAEDGIAAYKLAKKIVPDLIIADIRMPKMDGFQLLNKIKSDEKLKHIPVIAYSASVLKAQKERIHNSEFAGLLIKPVKVTELYLKLMNFLPFKSTREAESDKPLSEVDLIGEITNLPGLIHSLETGFHTTWKTFAVRQPIGEIRDFGKSLIQLGMDHKSGIITGYGKELISAADSFNIEALLKLIGKYKVIIESIKNSTEI